MSMKDLPTDEYLVDEEEEELPTAMELALRAAMGEEGIDIELPPKQRGRRRKKKGKRRYDPMRDEIISRTLATHQE